MPRCGDCANRETSECPRRNVENESNYANNCSEYRQR